MIGQERLKSVLETYLENNSFPRFVFIIGEEGSGRKTFAEYIANKLNCRFILFNNSVDDVRTVISHAYEQTEPIVYCIPEYEGMSNSARSSLLKVGEETPRNAYIIITAKNSSNILQTLLSRSVSFILDEYTPKELETIYMDFYKINSSENIKDILLDIAKNPGEIIKLKNVDCDKLNSFVDNVWKNLTVASEGNALKITNSLKIKEEDKDKYDINLFLNMLQRKVISEINTYGVKELEIGYEILKLISETKSKLSMNLNKQSLLDLFILKLRKVMYGIV